ncbi:aspartic peptidase domain-containing protein [Clohesyomyces aquaticus]|uniref:Aspartic peptidase domain-containing protein n=1 Tax=Clohesyomyces aquaticus TaxID=1231657 RepID=A0A1Y1ZWU6_9PLEO|nr:aspartic peptidase domain-containing protein [Clohesyomyces aquaticus]
MGGTTGSTKCNSPYFAFPIKNNTIGDGVALNRGLPVSIGGQPQGLRLTFFWNNTVIENGEDCRSSNNGASNATNCVGRSGGVFYIDKSSTWKPAPDGAWNGTLHDPVNNETLQETSHILRGWDTATFSGDVQVPGFPLAIWSETYISNRTALGLGSNDSSTLRALASAGLFPETPSQIGIYMASRSELYSTDGEIIFGGYDTSRINGSITWFPIGNRFAGLDCPFQVLLDDAKLITPNASNSLMSAGFTKVPFCIDPVQNAFTFPDAMWQTWTNLTKHPGINEPKDGSPKYTDQTYPWSNEALIGELQLTMSNDAGEAYSSRIPHFEMVSHERWSNAAGLYTVTNASRAMSAVVPPSGGMLNLPLLGGVFLSQNYMVIDWASGKFGLAPASTAPWDSSKRNINANCSAPKKSNRLTLIVVTVVICVLFVFSIAALFLLYRRKKARRAQQQEPAELSGSHTPLSQTPYTAYSEAPDTPAPRHFELHSPNKDRQEYPHEADSSAAPVEMDGRDLHKKRSGTYEMWSP